MPWAALLHTVTRPEGTAGLTATNGAPRGFPRTPICQRSQSCRSRTNSVSQVCLQPKDGDEFLQIKAGSQDQPHLDVDKKPKLQLFKYSQSNIACSQMMRGQTPVSLLLSPAIFNAASEKMLLLHQKQLIRGSIQCWELSKTSSSLTSAAITAEGLDPSTNVLLEEVEAVLHLLSKRVKQQILRQNQQMQHTRYFLNP